MKRFLISVSAAAAMALPMLPAVAAGPYDGTWQVDAGPAGNPGTNTTGDAQCEAIRLQFQVKDNMIQGDLARSPYGGNRVTSGGRGATPISGTVQPDGSFNSKWESYTANGKLTGDKAEMRWTGACGPRVATGGRISTESTGSSTGR